MTVDALGHDEIGHVAQAPTCTAIGWDAYVTCSRCDYSTYNEIPALGHTDGEWTVDIKETCATAGSKHQVCAVCGKTIATETISATGNHLWDDGEETQSPTCTEPGKITYKCTVCKTASRTEEIPALGHTDGEWITDIEPTCTTEGSKHQVCATCGETIATETISATGNHLWDDGEETQSPTCTEPGEITYKCTVCKTANRTEEVPALGHTDGEWITDFEPTCTTEGSKHQVCATCGETIKTEVVDALGHDEIEHVAQAPTCTEIGWDAYVTCGRCDHTTYVEIDPTGHNYENAICTICGKKEFSAGLEYTLSEDGTYYIVSGIGDCTDTNVIIPSIYEGKPVKEIGAYAFDGCSRLTSITIPSSVISIGEGALLAVIRGDGSPFEYYSSLVSINVDPSNSAYKSIDGNLYTKDGKILIQYSMGKTDTSFVIPNGITEVGATAFLSARNLVSITITDGVVTIGEGSFYRCLSLESIVIPNSTSHIYESAFADCVGLTSVVIGNSVTSIGERAFYNCFKLVEVVNNSNHITVEKGSQSNGMIGYYALAVYNPGDTFESNLSNDNGYIVYTDGQQKILVSYTGAEIDLVLPSYITTINPYALIGNINITSVIIPDSVTSIGEGAFGMCSYLNSVTIGNSVTSIGVSAFQECGKLTSINIPDGVTSIGDYAFYGCTSLTNVYLTDIAAWCNISFSDYSANPLYYADNLYVDNQLVTKLVIPDSVTSIGSYAFYHCSSLTSITIPDSVTSIGDYAFYGCSSLTSITIPFVGATKDGTSNTHFGYIFGASDYSYNNDYAPTSLKTVVITGGSSIDGDAFRDCNGLTSVTIGNSVVSIGERAFYGCSSLTSITIPESVTSIGNNAFAGCSSLTSVYITDIAAWCNISGLSYLTTNHLSAKQLYLNNELVTELVIPNGVTSIDNYAFSCCSSLTSITVPDSVTTIGQGAFGVCSYLNSVTIGNSVTSIGSLAFYNCSSLTSVTIGNSVTSIGSSAFSGCSSLTSIVIPDGVTSIGNNAFYGCSSLTSVTIGNGVTSIGSYAFRGCSSLTSITIPFVGATKDGASNTHFGYIFGASDYSYNDDYVPTSLKTVVITGGSSIDGDAFRDCNGITSVTIGNSVVSIGERAFSGCSSLTSITIPDSVTSIGNYAFFNCSSLTNIGVDANNQNYKSVDGNVYSKDGKTLVLYAVGKADTTFTIPDSVTSIGGRAFYGCDSLASVTIGNSVTSIGDYAFTGCDSLASIIIPDSVESISFAAFSNCISLTSVTIPDSATSIGNYAFFNCSSLTNVYYTGTQEQWEVISIGSSNTSLTNANICYNYTGE